MEHIRVLEGAGGEQSEGRGGLTGWMDPFKSYSYGDRISRSKTSDRSISVGIVESSGIQVAVKREYANTMQPRLRNEAEIYEVLRGGPGIPGVNYFGINYGYTYLAMTLLGPNLEQLFNFCGRKFSLKTVLMLASQMLNCVDFIHSKSILHRDIKADNFLVGLGWSASQVFVIDFGLATKYQDSTHSHFFYREDLNSLGDATYISMNAHRGVEHSWRDDLESLGYVLIYFLKGSLPWQGLKAGNKKEEYEMIRKKKVNTSIKELCEGCPPEFALYFHYCRSLQFDEKPDYAYVKDMFRTLFLREGLQFDLVFDWTLLKYQQPRAAAQKPRAAAQQPRMATSKVEGGAECFSEKMNKLMIWGMSRTPEEPIPKGIVACIMMIGVTASLVW